MAVNKNFVVKNGLEVSTDLIFADASTEKVGIGSTIPSTKFDVIGGIGASELNISGVGILKNAPNPSNAEKFIEYLLTDKIQKHIVENTYEYSIKKNIMPSDVIAQFGVDFKTDETFASEFGKYNSEAVRLMDRVGWR